jgi:hypothetical protein
MLIHGGWWNMSAHHLIFPPVLPTTFHILIPFMLNNTSVAIAIDDPGGKTCSAMTTAAAAATAAEMIDGKVKLMAHHCECCQRKNAA